MFSPVVAWPDEDAREDALDLGTDTMRVIHAFLA
jgi:hypothetical protein